jgi:hypothetical protein
MFKRDYRVMLLPSSDGFEYAIAVMLPWNADVYKATARVEEIIETYKRDVLDWDFEGIAAALEAAGFNVAQSVHGDKNWDDEVGR